MHQPTKPPPLLNWVISRLRFLAARSRKPSWSGTAQEAAWRSLDVFAEPRRFNGWVPEKRDLIIGPYETRPAVCRDYNPRAAVVARQIGNLIHEHLPQIFVEHVGSTSVPGCAGRGIVDLLIPVPQGDMEVLKEVLERLGFQRQPNRDPFPEDRPMRVGSVLYCGETFLLHVHCVPAESGEVEEMRFFRACLRADPYLVKAYVARKRAIIDGGVTDSLNYCRLKEEFVKEVLG